MTKKKNGRPYKITINDHRDLIRRKAAGQTANDLAAHFRIGLHTVYEYLKLDPETRRDA
ncbi:MAG: hypothetical protein ABL984_00450 [Pyrinomonadaceae bacterium]